jgi:putative ABC transport system permease protein
MMTEPRAINRAMFWRIIRRLLGANRGRLFVMLLALGAGAAVTAALLNLQVDAKRRLTTEFRAFGANLIIAPKSLGAHPEADALLNQSLLRKLPSEFQGHSVISVPSLYLIAELSLADAGMQSSVPVVVSGTELEKLPQIFPAWDFGPSAIPERKDAFVHTSRASVPCLLGTKLAARFRLVPFEDIELKNGTEKVVCKVADIITTGSDEDSQIFIDLPAAQQLASLSNRVGLIQISVDGPPPTIQQFQSFLAQKFSDVDVRPIRQFTEGEAKIYNRISGLLTATVGIVLLLTALCVMAAMTNVAMERKMDVGLMKAIGGATRRVIRLFLVEAALLGLAGGLIGAAAGIFLSMGLGKAVFGVAARPQLIVYPIAVGLTIFVAILSAFPLRRLASIRPASVFRGEA